MNIFIPLPVVLISCLAAQPASELCALACRSQSSEAQVGGIFGNTLRPGSQWLLLSNPLAASPGSFLCYLSSSVLQDTTLPHPAISLSRLTWREGLEQQQKTRSTKEGGSKEPNAVGLKLFFIPYSCAMNLHHPTANASS